MAARMNDALIAAWMNSLASEEEVLGAIRWFYHHPFRLIEEFPDGIIPIDRKIVALTKVPASELKHEGQHAIAFGASTLRASSIRIWVGEKVWRYLGFPDVSVTKAHLVDGTQQYTYQDQMDRFRYGPAWANNSCALDCVLVVLVMLDTGRCQADQVCGDLLRDNPLSQVVMTILRKPWSLLNTSEISSLRDLLRKELNRLNPTLYAIGSLQGVVSLFEDLTKSIPQFTATWGSVTRCCATGSWQWKLRQDGSVQTHRFNGFHKPLSLVTLVEEAETFEQQLQILLDPGPAAADRLTRCNKCKNSERPTQTRRILLDRPPLVLVISDFHELGKDGMFKSVNLTFQKLTDTGKIEAISTRYVCWGCIFCVNKNHFVLVWNRVARERKNDFAFYDGMSSEGKIQKGDRFQAYAGRKGYSLMLIFYVRV